MQWVDEEDVRAAEARIMDWPRPSDANELKTFLGVISKFRDKIWDYPKHIRPLANLASSKAKKFNWGLTEEDTFQEVKRLIVAVLKRNSKSNAASPDEPEEDAVEFEADQEAGLGIQLDDGFSIGEPGRFNAPNDTTVHITVEEKEDSHEPIPLPKEKSYKLVAPISKPGAEQAVAEKILDAEISLTGRMAMAISPGVAKEVRKQVSRTMQPRKPITETVAMAQEAVLPFMEESELEKKGLDFDALDIDELPKINCLFLSNGDDLNVPPGSLVGVDPYEVYLSTLAEDEEPKQVYTMMPKVLKELVAGTSGSLKTLYPPVAGRKHVEAITDSGSEIVSISRKVAEANMISWDPDTYIDMEGANGSMTRTLGLARNVSFNFGDITIFRLTFWKAFLTIFVGTAVRNVDRKCT